METRKVQSTGRSSCTVSLPREWTEKHDIGGGSVVELYTLGETVVITPERGESATAERVRIAGLEEGRVSRALVTLYVCGYDDILLEGDDIDAERRASIRQAVNRLTGLEVVDESSDAIRVRNLLEIGRAHV